MTEIELKGLRIQENVSLDGLNVATENVSLGGLNIAAEKVLPKLYRVTVKLDLSTISENSVGEFYFSFYTNTPHALNEKMTWTKICNESGAANWVTVQYNYVLLDDYSNVDKYLIGTVYVYAALLNSYFCRYGGEVVDIYKKETDFVSGAIFGRTEFTVIGAKELF